MELLTTGIFRKLRRLCAYGALQTWVELPEGSVWRFAPRAPARYLYRAIGFLGADVMMRLVRPEFRIHAT